MNIGFDASRAFTKNRTGTENYSFQLLHNLSLVDHTNTYYIYLRPDCNPDVATATEEPQNPDSSGPKAHQNDKNFWPDNFKFITIPYPRLWTQFGLAKQTFSDKLDVLFIPAHTLPLIRKPGLKTVVTVHDLGAEYLPQTHQFKQRLYLKLMTDFQLQSATRLIAVSEATKNDLIKKANIQPEKISVIYEGYNEELFKPIKNDLVSNILKEFDLEAEKYFLFVGTIQPRKNLIRLIKSYAQYSARGDAQDGSRRLARNTVRTDGGKLERQDPEQITPKLVLAGGRGWLSDEIYELPKKLGIADQVKFLGFVPDEKLPALYSGAKAFLFPSLFEGFGIPILEAFACGCPVLTSNISSMPEVTRVSDVILSDGERTCTERSRSSRTRVEGSPQYAAVLVDPYNENEIAESLFTLATDSKLRAKLIKSGFDQVQKFSWGKAAKETLVVLEKV